MAHVPALHSVPCKRTKHRVCSGPLPAQVRPPERMALPKKLRPPLHAFIRHLLRDVLAQDTLQHVGSSPTCRQPSASSSMSGSKPPRALHFKPCSGAMQAHADGAVRLRCHTILGWHARGFTARTPQQVLRKLRKLPWADNEWYLVRALLSATRGRAGAAPLLASLAAGLSRCGPSSAGRWRLASGRRGISR